MLEEMRIELVGKVNQLNHVDEFYKKIMKQQILVAPTQAVLLEFNAWLHYIKTVPIAEIEKVYNLQSKETWDGYKVLGITGTVEQRMLRKAKSNLKDKLRERYAKEIEIALKSLSNHGKADQGSTESRNVLKDEG